MLTADERMQAIQIAQERDFDSAFDSDADEMTRWGDLSPVMTSIVNSSKSPMDDDTTPLSSAIQSASVKELNKPNNRGWTAMHIAAHFSNIEAIKELLRAGAYPDGDSKRGGQDYVTPLFIALSQGDLAISQLLLEANPQPDINSPYDANGFSILRLALLHSDSNGTIVKKLLSMGADATIQDYQKKCVLAGTFHRDIYQDESTVDAILQPLFDAGLRVDQQTLQEAESASPPLNSHVLKAILEHSAEGALTAITDVEINTEPDVLSPFLQAISDAEIDTVKSLLARADAEQKKKLLNCVGLISDNALSYWVDFDNEKAEKAAKILKPINPTTEGDKLYHITPLELAATRQDKELITILKDAGAEGDDAKVQELLSL